MNCTALRRKKKKEKRPHARHFTSLPVFRLPVLTCKCNHHSPLSHHGQPLPSTSPPIPAHNAPFPSFHVRALDLSNFRSLLPNPTHHRHSKSQANSSRSLSRPPSSCHPTFYRSHRCRSFRPLANRTKARHTFTIPFRRRRSYTRHSGWCTRGADRAACACTCHSEEAW